MIQKNTTLISYYFSDQQQRISTCSLKFCEGDRWRVLNIELYIGFFIAENSYNIPFIVCFVLFLSQRHTCSNPKEALFQWLVYKCPPVKCRQNIIVVKVMAVRAQGSSQIVWILSGASRWRHFNTDL